MQFLDFTVKLKNFFFKIKRTCEWLYPTNPEAVTTRKLYVNLLRDSCDPGGPLVIASGPFDLIHISNINSLHN